MKLKNEINLILRKEIDKCVLNVLYHKRLFLLVYDQIGKTAKSE